MTKRWWPWVRDRSAAVIFALLTPASAASGQAAEDSTRPALPGVVVESSRALPGLVVGSSRAVPSPGAMRLAAPRPLAIDPMSLVAPEQPAVIASRDSFAVILRVVAAMRERVWGFTRYAVGDGRQDPRPSLVREVYDSLGIVPVASDLPERCLGGADTTAVRACIAAHRAVLRVGGLTAIGDTVRVQVAVTEPVFPNGSAATVYTVDVVRAGAGADAIADAGGGTGAGAGGGVGGGWRVVLTRIQSRAHSSFSRAPGIPGPLWGVKPPR